MPKILSDKRHHQIAEQKHLENVSILILFSVSFFNVFIYAVKTRIFTSKNQKWKLCTEHIVSITHKYIHIYACMHRILQPVLTSVRFLHRNAFCSSQHSQSIKFLQRGIRGEDIEEADHLQEEEYIRIQGWSRLTLQRFIMIHFTVIL